MKMCANLLCQLTRAHGSVLNIIAIANLLKIDIVWPTITYMELKILILSVQASLYILH